ncbi:MarR family transcriptional regulator [Sulfitobacter sp. JBTF-M27]|uniref:MarR family transcriptional regulator n=1 Tax=Sulfitobacter sediminilitoris TaxID=2698830 RepID=A0A6P0C8U5_9RHOB|nr:MarR family transcriptional regulator [Sulfitobacter sediminilitoris]NEK21840.1 MarR family transcriptional regulator [Sulfitobacter sediminilitoris]
MSRDLKDAFGGRAPLGKHPAAATIEDVITFQLHILVAIGERAGQHWSERMFDLSLNEWRLLALVKARGPCRASDLADLLLMDKSQTSRVIKSLQKKDLIQNMADPTDGRAVVLKISQKGNALYKDVFAEVMNSNERILAALSVEEVEAFEKTLKKLIGHSQDLLEVRLGRKIVR